MATLSIDQAAVLHEGAMDDLDALAASRSDLIAPAAALVTDFFRISESWPARGFLSNEQHRVFFGWLDRVEALKRSPMPILAAGADPRAGAVASGIALVIGALMLSRVFV
jgi:hypothetical protein